MRIVVSLFAGALFMLSISSCCKKHHPSGGDCFCPAVYDPVCGSDGKVYSNYCEAKCAGVDTVSCLPWVSDGAR